MDENLEYQKTERGVERNNWMLWGILGILIFAAVVIGVTYFSNVNAPQSESRLSQVLDRPEDYYGQEVTLIGEVEDVIGSRALTLDAPQPLSQNLLVISRQPMEPIGGSGVEDYLYEIDDRISVTGTVMLFNLRQIEEALGVELVDEEFSEWEGRPVMVAENVESER